MHVQILLHYLNCELSKTADSFMKDKVHKVDIIKCGENTLDILYNGDPEDDLNGLYLESFKKRC